MQSPDSDNWDHQNHEVAHNIDDTSADENGILIKAFLSPSNFVGFADALGRNGEDERDRVEKIPIEDEPDAIIRLGISASSSIYIYYRISVLLCSCVEEKGCCSCEETSLAT